MNLTTFTSRAAAALVAAVAGFASYRHIYDVATEAGEHQGVAAVLPLAIDGLILVATLAMLDDKRHQRRPRLSARVALVFGILATLAANVASAESTVTARLVAAVPAVSFLLAVEVLARSGKPLPVAAPVELVDEPAPVDPWDYAQPIGPVASPPVEPDAKPAVTRTRPRSLTSAQKVAKAAAKLPTGTVAQVAAKAGVSESTARRYLPSPTGPVAAETRVNGTSVEVSTGA
ncbi:DUF2637 domain-containing protein [Micromonospora sp. U21]|uniref:DUF2637 domain-containing protein n=1 Tax=Micromonospora sp. U21 TaxID=2824899 RepID=UPI001B377B1F|nr:DUF2637 domain-containing protein [Micromonospora sp. U21]MBQ0902687.1 DUF2637 domain-containing protein [Micromonospora sp. U21]